MSEEEIGQKKIRVYDLAMERDRLGIKVSEINQQITVLNQEISQAQEEAKNGVRQEG